jgi:hypothetical protein
MNNNPFINTNLYGNTIVSAPYQSNTKSFSGIDNLGALKTLTVTTRRLKDGPYGVNSWPQGKMCIDTSGRIYVGFNSANGHPASNSVCYTTFTDDGGMTWSPAKPVKVNTGGYSNGMGGWGLGVDNNRRLYATILNRGNSQAVGVSNHELYISDDFGVTWTLVGQISEITQDGYVPTLFHDMEQVGDKMVTGFHFDDNKRVGLLSISIADPTVRTFVDIVPPAAGSPDWVEVTLCYDSVNNKIIGALRAQQAASVTQLFFINTDFTGYQQWTAAQTIRFSPCPIKIVGDKIVYSLIERYSVGNIFIFIGNLSDFYLKSNVSTYSIEIGRIIATPISTSTSTDNGVADMVVNGSMVYLAFASERDATHSSLYFSSFDLNGAQPFLNYSDLSTMTQS